MYSVMQTEQIKEQPRSEVKKVEDNARLPNQTNQTVGTGQTGDSTMSCLTHYTFNNNLLESFNSHQSVFDTQ